MKLYIAKCSDFAGLEGAELLDPQRRERLEKYNKAEDKQRCLAAGLLLRCALGDMAAQIIYGEKGKPCLPNGPHFNLSHSGDYAVLGMSEHELGVDIEKIGGYKDKVARRSCTAEELAWLEAQDKAEFYRLWTAKESIMKATGLGLSMAPGSFSVLPCENGRHVIDGICWYLTWLALPGYCLCCACAADEEIELCFPDKKALLE